MIIDDTGMLRLNKVIRPCQAPKTKEIYIRAAAIDIVKKCGRFTEVHTRTGLHVVVADDPEHILKAMEELTRCE